MQRFKKINTTKQYRNFKENSTTYTNKDNKMMEIDDIQEIYNKLKSDLKKHGLDKTTKISIVGRTGMNNYWTIKSYAEKDLYLDSYDDYFSSKVKDTSKFENFASITVTLSGRK